MSEERTKRVVDESRSAIVRDTNKQLEAATTRDTNKRLEATNQEIKTAASNSLNSKLINDNTRTKPNIQI